MRYSLLIFCVLVSGCDAIRSTTDRVFGGSPAPATEAVQPAEVEDSAVPPQPAAASVGWTGAKTTVAGLGDPNTPGRWLQTPLVDVEINGRVVVPRTGAQAFVTLVPAPDGGSRLSLDAMRALLLPFDELVELEVYSD